MVEQCAATVVVVDADPCDYGAIASLAEAGEIDLRLFASGRSALQRAGDLQAAIWMVNVQLPDWSGFDLVEMLRDQIDGATVCIVSPKYRTEEEVRSYRTGAAMYVCKPVEASWVRAWVHQQRARSAAPRGIGAVISRSNPGDASVVGESDGLSAGAGI